MKYSVFFALALFAGTVANAQTDTTTKPVTDTTTNPVADTSVVQMVDTSVGKAYVANPQSLQGLTTETLTTSHIFPAVGTFKGTGTSTADVVITLDETNKGLVWVEGLPQGRFRAIMKKAPSTYKIPAQKSESGKAIAEGTLFVNPETNELSILLGQSFNEKAPTSFVTVASKSKNTFKYTGTKAVTEAPVATPETKQ
jgi:hypothetical protein